MAFGVPLATIAAVGGAATTAIGAGLSYVGSQNAASAARNAQEQQMAAQNQAFEARNAAQVQQTTEQAAAQNQGQANYLAQEQAMRANQSGALQKEQDVINTMNQQEQQVQQNTQQQVQNTTQNVITPQTLAAAQATSQAQREAGTTPVVQDIAASDPTASPATAGSATKSAMADAMAKAAAYTQQYGKNLAVLGSYSAPVATTGLATKDLAMGLMPSAAADQLLKAGASARLLPSQVAYQNATNLGQSEIASNTQRTNDLMSLSKMREQNAVDEATLGQADTNANIQTGLNAAQARAAALSSVGQGVSAVGNAGLLYGASKGGFSDLFGAPTPTDADLTGLSTVQTAPGLKLGLSHGA
jgi:hypothetical protein